MPSDSYDLVQIARQVMLSKGLQPDYSKAVIEQATAIQTPAAPSSDVTDLRKFYWCSIDNDDSRDLDQLTFAEEKQERLILWVAVADVDALVHKDTPIDLHAQINTTTVYTPSKNFPMLPEKLSTNLTSLNEGQDRVAVVIKIEIDEQGEILDSTVQHAWVHNYAQLTYSAVGDWLEGKGALPAKVAKLSGLDQNLKLQNRAAQILRQRRYSIGALSLETPEAVPIFSGQRIVGMEPARINSAHRLIEHFMISANTVIARFLAKGQIPSLRRIVRIPKRWDKIVEVAAKFGDILPSEPDSKALDVFLVKRKKEDPEGFPDLSLTIVKLLGSGEYVVELPGEEPVGHFGLALRDYTHSTAPNRRYPDMITQRQVKCLLIGCEPHYSRSELGKLAYHCTIQEDAAAKVERQLRKSAAALVLKDHIGEMYDGIVTGASDKGTYVRIFNPAAEGRIIEGMEGLDVGDHVKVTLLAVDVPRGYIDFAAK